MHSTIQKLIANGKIYKFKDLPEEAQLAIVHYMGVDGEAWDLERFGVFEGLVNTEEKLNTARKYLSHHRFDDDFEQYVAAHNQNAQTIVDNLKKALPEIVKGKADSEYGLVTVPTKDLIDAWAEIDSDAVQDFSGDFDAYHAWYQSHRGESNRGGGDNPTWPVILSDFEDEILQDGWHRFHQYIANGAKKIACLWYPEEGVVQWDMHCQSNER